MAHGPGDKLFAVTFDGLTSFGEKKTGSTVVYANITQCALIFNF